jgi:SET family sugar efflux transporter-like MFS transporter
LAPLGFVTTLVGLTGSFVTPFLPLFLTQSLHASPGQVSMVLFGTPLAAVVVAWTVGRISDRPGMRRRILLSAAAAGIIGFAVYGLWRNYWVLLGSSLTLVAIAGALMPQLFAFGRELVDRQDPSRGAMGMSTLRMMVSLSWAAGAPLGAFVLGLIDFQGLFLATAATHIVILGVLALFKPSLPAKRQPAPPAATSPTASVGGVRLPSKRTLIGTTIAFVVVQSVTSLTVTTMPLFISVTLNGSVSSAGFVLGLCAAIEVPLMLLFGSLASRWPVHRLLYVGGGFGMAYCLAVSVAESVWQVALAQVLHACFVCAFGGLGISYFQELMPSAVGRATTLYSNSARMSGMLAGVVFGVVQLAGYRFAYIVAFGLCALGTAILAITRRLRATAVSADESPAPATA